MEERTGRHLGDITSDYRFAPIPEQMLYESELSDGAVRVYGVLARHGFDPSTCWPSRTRIASLTGKSEATVKRALRELREAGWIEAVGRVSGDGLQTSNGYHLRTRPCTNEHRGGSPATRANTEGGSPVTQGGVTDDPPRGVRYDPPGGSDMTPEREPSNESQSKETARAGGGVDAHAHGDEFDLWWERYPRKDGKQRARQAWEKLMKGSVVSAATLHADLDRRLGPWQQWQAVGEGHFVPHAATFLNQHRWEDPLPEPRQTNGRRSPTAILADWHDETDETDETDDTTEEPLWH